MKHSFTLMDKLTKATGYLSAGIMMVVMVVVVVNVIARRFFNAPIFGITEIARFGMMISASFSLMITEWNDGNIQMTALRDLVKGRARLIMNSVTHILATVCFIYVAYYLFIQMAYRIGTGETSTDLHIYMWILVLILALGCLLQALVSLVKAVVYVKAAILNKRLSEVPFERNEEQV